MGPADPMEPPLSACELPAPTDASAPPGTSGSKVLRFRDGFQWEGVVPRAYKDPAAHWRGIARHVLVGEGGESAPFHVRYFEIEPRGHSTREVHEHEHVVIPIRGRGVARLGDRDVPIGFGDVVYIAPNDVHQFLNRSGEPFGFLCIVPASRDRPRPIG